MNPLSLCLFGRTVVLLLGWLVYSGSSLAQQCVSGSKGGPALPVRKIFVVAGQSNAVGLASVRDITRGPRDVVRPATVFPHVKIYGIYGAPPGVLGNDDAMASMGVKWSRFASWQLAQPGFGFKNVESFSDRFPAGVTAKEVFGPELYLARYLNDLAPRDHYIVKLAVSNTSLHPTGTADHWAPGSRLYGQLMQMIADAHNSQNSKAKLQVAGLFWMQGESDALNAEWARKYKNNLRTFIGEFRQSMVRMGCAKDRKLPVVLGKIQNNSAWIHKKPVRLAQMQLAREMPSVRLVNTDDFSGHLTAGGVHFNEYAQSRLGKRVFRAFVDKGVRRKIN